MIAETLMSETDLSLVEMVREAARIGHNISVGDAKYGPASWGRKEFVESASPYYFFLAGWCRLTEARRVIEVGTHFGGSTLGMLSGMPPGADKRLVTMDVTDLNKQRLSREPAIVKLVGDGSDAAVQKKAIGHLGADRCDLLYVDALKDRDFVMNVLDGFCSLIPVRYAILDDISITPPMRTMWAEVTERFGENAVDITKICPEVRDASVGFGVIRLQDRS